MAEFDKLKRSYFPAVISKFEDNEKLEPFINMLPQLEDFFLRNRNGNIYLSGSNSTPMMIDFQVYPIAERIILLENSPLCDKFA